MDTEDVQLKNVLYQDSNVKITEQKVKVLKFYFPQDSQREVLIKNICKMGLKQMDEMDEALGVSPQFFKNFKERVKEGKNMYIEMENVNEIDHICFAPNEPLKVFKLIQQKWGETKKQQLGRSEKALKENSLYSNVELTAEKIQKVMEQLKNQEEENRDLHEGIKKRSIEQRSLKTVDPYEGQTGKKRVKEASEQEKERQEKENS